MTKEEQIAKNAEKAPAGEPAKAPESVIPEARPMRDKFAERYKKRHPDNDFENKEERYGTLGKDADKLDSYDKTGAELGKLFDKHPFLSAMTADLADNPDLDPITWMAKNGIDINEALMNDDYKATIAEKIKEYQDEREGYKNEEKETQDNMTKSAHVLEARGYDNERNNKLWTKFFEILADADKGIITDDTWAMLDKADRYDDDVKEAREEGAMSARNERIANKVKKPEEPIPPSLNTGSGKVQSKKKKSEVASFWEGLE